MINTQPQALNHKGYRDLIMQMTSDENREKAEIASIEDTKVKEERARLFEYEYFWRRLINAEFYKNIKSLVEKSLLFEVDPRLKSLL
jgi:hypothetical protein